MPPPTPVPSVTMTMLRAPFAEPAVASPSAAQLASLSSCTAQPNSGRNASAKQTLFMPRLVPNLSVQVALSNEPGTPMPMLVMPPPTPVPSVTMTMLRAPFAEPAVASPSAAQLASLSSCTAQPNSGRNASAKQTLFMPRLVPNLSVQVALSNEPGTPMPMLVM